MTGSDGQGGETPRKERRPQLELEKLEAKLEKKSERKANALFARVEEKMKQPPKPPAPVDKETSAGHKNSVNARPHNHSPERDTARASAAAVKGRKSYMST